MRSSTPTRAWIRAREKLASWSRPLASDRPRHGKPDRRRLAACKTHRGGTRRKVRADFRPASRPAPALLLGRDDSQRTAVLAPGSRRSARDRPSARCAIRGEIDRCWPQWIRNSRARCPILCDHCKRRARGTRQAAPHLHQRMKTHGDRVPEIPRHAAHSGESSSAPRITTKLALHKLLTSTIYVLPQAALPWILLPTLTC